MRAGTLNRRIWIKKQGPNVDELGEPLPGPGEWVNVFPTTIAANILHKSGLETLKSDADTSVVKASIRVRYRAGIAANMRVLHNDTTYDILAVLADESGKEYMDLVCQTGAISA